MRRLGDPRGELSIEVGDVRKPPRREEGMPQVLDRPLDLAFLVAAIRGARFRGEVIMPGQLEQPWVVADVVAHPLEDDALQIVVEECAGNPMERVERFHVAAQETLERLVEHEARVDGSRPRETRTKQRAAGARGRR